MLTILYLFIAVVMAFVTALEYEKDDKIGIILGTVTTVCFAVLFLDQIAS